MKAYEQPAHILSLDTAASQINQWARAKGFWDEAIAAKMAKNEDRPQMHGKSF